MDAIGDQAGVRSVMLDGDTKPFEDAVLELRQLVAAVGTNLNGLAAEEVLHFRQSPSEFIRYYQQPTMRTDDRMVIVFEPSKRFLELLATLQALKREDGIEVPKLV